MKRYRGLGRVRGIYVYAMNEHEKMQKASLYRWAALISVPSLFIAISSAVCLNTSYSTSASDIFTTLSSVQAAIFAIVFSVTILGVQLSASQYSPRLINVFRNSPAYLFTSSLFIISIGFNVLGLFWDSLSGLWLSVFVHTAGAFAITSLFILYIFVDRTLYNSTPEGLLNRIKSQMTPENIVTQATHAQDNPSEPDPFLNALAVIRTALQNQDSPTVALGLNIIAERAEDLFQSNQEAVKTDQSAIAESIEQLCTVRIPPLVESAVEQERGEEAETIINCIEEIAEAGIEEDIGYVPRYAVEGLSDSIVNIDHRNSAERIRKELSDTGYKCLKRAGEAELWDGTATGVLLLTWRVAQSILSHEAPHNRGDAYVNLLILGVPKINSSAIADVEDQIDDKDVNWLHAEHESDTSDLHQEERILYACYVGMCEVTSAAIRNELSTERQLVRWDSIGAGWDECVEKAEDSTLESLYEQWLGTALYIEYLRTETPDVTLSGFPDISMRTDSPRTIKVIDKILNGDLDAKAQVDHVPGYGHPIELPPLTGYRASPLSNPNKPFEDWLKRRKSFLEQNSGFLS